MIITSLVLVPNYKRDYIGFWLISNQENEAKMQFIIRNLIVGKINHLLSEKKFISQLYFYPSNYTVRFVLSVCSQNKIN